MSVQPGYAGKLLRINLTNQEATEERYDEATLRKYIGGAGFGAKILYEEVPPGVSWSDPDNRLILASGPLGGTQVKGSGTISAVCKGPLTNGATSSQANGFMGAFLRLCGYDGLILQGSAPQWIYIFIHEDGVEFRDAEKLVGKNTDEAEGLIRGETGLPKPSVSVAGVGPAGENLVKFAAIIVDGGHVIAHNGAGAVMGSKKLKAIAVARGKRKIAVYDSKNLRNSSNELLDYVKKDPAWGEMYKWGMMFEKADLKGLSGPMFWSVKNYQSNHLAIEPGKFAKFCGSYIRKQFKPKRNSCWACPFHHCCIIEITEGPYVGHVGEEPEAEALSAWGFLIGNTDVTGAIVLNNDCDKLGLDVNEAGWTAAFMLELYEKGLITKKDTDGIDLTWGNVGAVRELLRQITYRKGVGNILAEGVLSSVKEIGGEAPNIAIYIKNGTTPRTHDLRLRWNELFDTIVSNICTIENDGFPRPTDYGLPPLSNPFDPIEVSTMTANLKGSFQFLDSLGACKFPNRVWLPRLVEAATGWDFTMEEELQVGRRAINLFRAFNVRHGLTPDKEWPSPRLGSAPLDGPAVGVSIIPALPQMLDNYYQRMGWDRATGKPFPETLGNLGLDEVINDLW